MLERDINCPRTSSMGRVFDAAAGLLGLCAKMQYEAQAAILLEQAATRYIETHGWPQPMERGWRIDSAGRLDLLPVLASLDAAVDADQAAAGFHATLAAALGEWVAGAANSSGITTLAWGGGCFLNALLSVSLRQNLEQRGIAVLAPMQLPPDDSGIALGQAWVAMQTLEQ
jgi:hydrogenase maturation protein HypF